MPQVPEADAQVGLTLLPRLRLAMIILGVSERRGLPCRAPGVCPKMFPVERPSDPASLADAVAVRDAHELVVHGYVHQPMRELAYGNYQYGVSHMGRSLLGRKKRRVE